MNDKIDLYSYDRYFVKFIFKFILLTLFNYSLYNIFKNDFEHTELFNSVVYFVYFIITIGIIVTFISSHYYRYIINELYINNLISSKYFYIDIDKYINSNIELLDLHNRIYTYTTIGVSLCILIKSYQNIII